MKITNTLATRKATTVWTGDLSEGSGKTSLDSSGIAEFNVSWPARMATDPTATSPEELIGAALSACYNMWLAMNLGNAGYKPDTLRTTAIVTLDSTKPGGKITSIHLLVNASIPGIPEPEFKEIAHDLETNHACAVSKALAGVPSITMEASLV